MADVQPSPRGGIYGGVPTLDEILAPSVSLTRPFPSLSIGSFPLLPSLDPVPTPVDLPDPYVVDPSRSPGGSYVADLSPIVSRSDEGVRVRGERVPGIGEGVWEGQLVVPGMGNSAVTCSYYGGCGDLSSLLLPAAGSVEVKGRVGAEKVESFLEELRRCGVAVFSFMHPNRIQPVFYLGKSRVHPTCWR
jgi:hypothetical protein